MNTPALFASEYQQEAAKTKKILERVPADKLAWKPHEKSMTLGRLAMHIAELPGWVKSTLETEGFDFGKSAYKPVIPASRDEIMQEFERSLAKALEGLGRATEEQLDVTWTATRGDQVVFAVPRRGMIRNNLGHIIHHRGQLSVYLRLLGVPIPNIYGPTADER
jgi:uncharacterized damage-inducible protein DinB